MMGRFNWRQSPKNVKLADGLHGDSFSYCENCDTRTHFHVERCGFGSLGSHRYTCHTCGRSSTRGSLCKLPREMRKDNGS